MLALPLAAQAQSVWKWRDAAGAVQISDRPPPKEIPDKDILLRPPQAPRAAEASAASAVNTPAVPSAAPAPPPAPGNSSADKELESRRKRLQDEQQAARKAQEAQQKDKQEAARRDNCDRARGYLSALDSGQRIGRYNASGERELLDDAARAQERTRTLEQIEQNCR